MQEELRKRNLYFGDVDGRATPETEAALRRYQERKGFDATGAATPETLSSLGLGAAGEAGQWPDLPVLRSDGAREVTEKDRAFLDQLAKGNVDLPPVAEPPPEKEPEEPAMADAPPIPAPEPKKESVRESAERFLRDYLRASESNDLASEMAFYAERVDYFDHGVVDRRFMEKDIGGNYYKRWPQRRYKLLAVRVAPPAAGEEEITVRFRMRFDVKSAKGAATGQTDNTFKIQRGDDGKMRFVSMRERRVRG